MRTIRVAFSDFYRGFNYKNFLLYKLLCKHYNVVIEEKEPDFLIYSCYSAQFLKYQNCIRIFWTGEPIVPNFNLCDYSISFTREQFGGRNLYSPLALMRLITTEIEEAFFSISAPQNRKFCSFVYSNETEGIGAMFRKEFCQELMSVYKHVDCAGKVLHNCDDPILSSRGAEEDWHRSKIRFLSQYKFNIAFENTYMPGYITEKLVDPFFANSVPIYWGSNGDIRPFSKDAMICANDFADTATLVDYIKYVDTHNDVYKQLLANNPIRKMDAKSHEKKIEDFLVSIVEDGKRHTTNQIRPDPLLWVKEFAILSFPAQQRMKNILALLSKLTSRFR